MNEKRLIDDERIATFERFVDAYGLLSKRLGDAMEAATGLPLLWYGVLLFIGRSPQQIRSMNELSDATAFTSGGVTRLVDRMADAGYVERRPCPTDRRVHYVGLTDRGHHMLERATDVHLHGIQEHIMDVLETEEIAHLDAILTKLVASRGHDG